MRIADCRLQNKKPGVISFHSIICIGVFAAIMLTVCCSITLADEVYSKNKKGNEQYKKGNYEEALKQYGDALLLAPGDKALKMNRGSALYRLGNYGEAENEYNGALSLEDKKKLAEAHYNMGNIQFRLGEELARSGGQGATEKYKSALEHYIKALDLQPHDKDTKWNIELAQRRIKQQEQQQQQNKQNKQDKDEKKNQNKQQEQDKKEQQDQEKKDQENKQEQNKQDQDKKDHDQKKQDEQNQNQDQSKQNQDQKQPQPQPNKDDMKKEEARRIIMQFADDADTLNKPPKQKGLLMKMKKPEKDW